jgi:hypothetical protein
LSNLPIIIFQGLHDQSEKIIKYCEFHQINQSGFKEDLKNTSFVSSPACDLPELCDQYLIKMFHLNLKQSIKTTTVTG